MSSNLPQNNRSNQSVFNMFDIKSHFARLPNFRLPKQALALVIICASTAFAQSPSEVPSRVGRVSYVQGSTYVQYENDRGWEDARVNLPITSRNSLWTDARGRTEIRMGGTSLALDEYSQLDIQRLDDDNLDAYLQKGVLAVAVRYMDRRDSYVISTPEGRVELRNDGRYRIEVDSSQARTFVSVFRGSARFEEGGNYTQIEPGNTLAIDHNSGRIDYQWERVAYRAFDDWTSERANRYDRRSDRRNRYVSTWMTGYEDLDEHGEWSRDSEYGTVWYPRTVDTSWVPYRHGRWTHVQPWGWTWVDDAPWGYAPFHYGRWVHINNRWGWCPGQYSQRPVWAPALVGFYDRPGLNVSISVGSRPAVGWYPLAPWDRYQPGYIRANHVHVGRLNNFVHINRPSHHRHNHPNRDYHRTVGATVVPRENFNSANVFTHRVAVPNEQIIREPINYGGRIDAPRGQGRPNIVGTLPTNTGQPVVQNRVNGGSVVQPNVPPNVGSRIPDNIPRQPRSNENRGDVVQQPRTNGETVGAPPSQARFGGQHVTIAPNYNHSGPRDKPLMRENNAPRGEPRSKEINEPRARERVAPQESRPAAAAPEREVREPRSKEVREPREQKQNDRTNVNEPRSKERGSYGS